MTAIQKNNETMWGLIDAFPENLIQALGIAKKSSLSNVYPTFNNVIICGMGGSGIGGKLISSWIADEISIPINFCQNYSLPNYVDSKTLIIASSNSGNTEETLSATEDAQKKGASIIAICSGGKLEQYCKQYGFEYILIPGGKPPRTQLAFSIVQLIHIFVELGLVKKDKLNEFAIANELLIENKEQIHSIAEELANFIYGKELIIYSEAKDEAVAIRARQQFNENSKVLCNHHTIPEMNHNEIVGWYGGTDRYAVLFLDTDDWHYQNKKRLAFSYKTIQAKTNSIKTIKAKGKSSLVKSLYLINIIDWASIYAAKKNGIDSICIDVIDELKSSLQD